ncbi:MAG: carboxypeptidase regulatory-like domain-containing protein [Myxococcales bacterium]
MRFRNIAGIATAGAVSLVLAMPALAQTTGTLSGQVVDANSQQPVGDAVVIAQSPSLQGEQTAVTDASGAFEITLLPAGTYSVTVQRESYQPFTQSGLRLALDRSIKVKLSLVPEALKEQAIEIVAQRPSISVTTTQQGGSISKEQMVLVPYGRNGRTFDQVATSIPGVQPDANGGIQMNGSGGPEQNYIIDGVNVSDPAFGTLGTTLIQDFVQEVDIKTGGYQAEYGRATGGIINVVTKSGGNEFHGSVFVNWSPFEAPRKQIGGLGQALSSQVSQRYNLDFGAELGGPIVKDKLWFFAGFAPQFISRNVDRIVSAQTSDQAGQAVLDPNGNPRLTELARQTYPSTQTTYNMSGKLTYLITENHSVALAGYGNPTTNNGVYVDRYGFFTSPAGGSEGFFLANHELGAFDTSLRYSGKLFNKSMLVEATAAYHRQRDNDVPVGVNGQSASALGDLPSVSWQGTRNLLDPQLQDSTVPSSQKSAAVLQGCAIQPNGFNPCPVTNYFDGGFGFAGQRTLNRIGGVLKLSNFVEALGHHQFKYGVDASRDTFDQSKTYTGGALVFATPTTGTYVRAFGHADPASPGQPAFEAANPNLLQGSTVSNVTHNTSIAAFAQDTWNLFDRVVLDAGIRVEKQLMYADTKTLDATGNPVNGAGINLTNVMPRIGLIYDFTGRGLSKVYGSYGRFYEYVPLDLADRSLSSETQVNLVKDLSNCTNPADMRTCSTIPNAFGAGKTYTFTGGSASTPVDPNLQGQYTDEYLGGVQYQAYRDITVGVDYVHKQIGRVIEDMSTNDGATYFLSNPGEQGKLGYSGTTGGGTTIVEPKPRRVYDGLTLSVNKTFSDNWLLTASYTYSSFRGNYPGLFSIRGVGAPQTDPNILSEYDLLSLLPNKDGPLPGDIPNSFKVDAGYVWELNPRFTFNFGGNIRADQGQPISYLGAHPLYGPGEAYVLPRGSGGRTPWTWQLNLRGGANYKLSKSYALGFTLDLFNVTDNREVLTVDQNYTFNSVSPIVNGKTSDLPSLKTVAGQNAIVNTNFNNATAYQLPFSARLGAKLSF